MRDHYWQTGRQTVVGRNQSKPSVESATNPKSGARFSLDWSEQCPSENSCSHHAFRGCVKTSKSDPRKTVCKNSDSTGFSRVVLQFSPIKTPSVPPDTT